MEKDIGGIVQEFDARNINYELILVNNGSQDKTGELIDKLKNKSKRVKTVHLKKNAQFGGGIRAGLAIATGKYVGFTCSDGQVSPKDILKILEKLKRDRLDLCKSRRIIRRDGLVRYVISKVYNALVFSFFFLRVKDINGYPILMKHNVYQDLNITSVDWMINVEILHKAVRRKYRWEAVPIEFRSRERGKSHVSIKTPLTFFMQLLKFRFTGARK